jgi:hypothetical protein
MTTVGDEAVGRSDAQSKRRRGARTAAWGVGGLALSLALSACGASYDYYVEGHWDNGDGVMLPSKTVLWDDNGDPTCAFPVKWLNYERRSTPLALAQGLAFELTNPNLDPNAPLSDLQFPTAEDKAKEIARRTWAEDPLALIWQYTSPEFDAEHGITGPDDLAGLKADLGGKLYGVGQDAPLDQYTQLVQTYATSDAGTFVLVRVDDPRGYIAEHGIPLQFQGLRNTYYTATDGTEEYLLVRSKSSDDAKLWQGDVSKPLGAYKTFVRVQVYNRYDPFHPPSPVVEFLFESDGCPMKGGHPYERFWLLDYTTNPDEFYTADDEPEPEPEPSPSPSA